MKKIFKLSKVFLLFVTVFSYIASPISVLADEISNSNYRLDTKLEVIFDENGYADYYKFTYESANDDYELDKNYKIELTTAFTYNDETTTANIVDLGLVSGGILNSTESSYNLDPISKYYDGIYSLDIAVYDNEDVVYEDNYTYSYNTLKGLTGKLNGILPTSEDKTGNNNVGNYDVTIPDVYTQNLCVLTGELSPNKMYRVLNNDGTYSSIMTGEELRMKDDFTGTETDLNGKLGGKYSYTDSISFEEVELISESEEVNVINTFTYTYDSIINYNSDNNALFNDIFLDKATFADGYMIVFAKEYMETEKVITIQKLVDSLAMVELEKENKTTIEVLDNEGNLLDLTDLTVLASEIKNEYVVKFINGATASYIVVVKGDITFDNTFNDDDLSDVIDGYIEEEQILSMDMVTLEEEVLEEGSEEPIIKKEEFGTITFEDILFANELLKENGNVDKEEIDNTGLILEYGELSDELFVGDVFEIDVLVNSEDVLDYIDGIDAYLETSENIKLSDVKFNNDFIGSYNDEGRIVGVGGELNSGSVVMTLVFTANGEGESFINLSGLTSKFLNIDEFESIFKEFSISRKVSSNNNLISLNANVGTFDIEFDKDVTVYTLTVPYDTISVILSGGLEDVYSSVQGLELYELIDNKMTAIITVTAEDGSVKTYTVYIIKENAPVIEPITYYYSSNNYLKLLEVDGYDIAFDKYNNKYNITLKDDIESLDIRALAEDYRSRVEITGNGSFVVGENTVTIKVIAENGSVREYTLVVNKEDEEQVKVDDSSNTVEKIVIVVLIILVVLGLLYLIFKKDEEEAKESNNIPKKEIEKKNNSNNANKNINSKKNTNTKKKKK